jgi:cytochrome P450
MTAAPMFPFDASDPCTPCEEYREFRRTRPIAPVTLPTGHRAWLLTRHPHVRAVLEDPQFSREALLRPGAPALFPPPPAPSIFFMDPPGHHRLRRLVEPVFRRERTEQLRWHIDATSEGLLDGLVESEPPADMLAQVAKPLPIMVLCTLLGVPDEDVDSVRGWTDVMFDFDTQPDAGMTAFRALPVISAT